jgi:hypothetical protein
MFYSLLFIAQALCAPTRSFLPKNISYSAPGLLPEGFDYFEKKGVFYLGSLTQGTISSVSLDGEQKTVVPTIIEGYGTSGIQINQKTGDVYACIVDFSMLSLATGAPVIADGAKSFIAKLNKELEIVYVSQLPQKRANFCNDIKITRTGLIISDSASNFVFKVDGKGAVSDYLELSQASFLDGIEQTRSGTILVSDYLLGKLYRICGDSGVVSEVLNVTAGYDGIYLASDSKLVAVSGGNYHVLTTVDDFKTVNEMTFALPGEGYTATAITPVGENQFAINNAYGFSVTQDIYTIDFVTI